ncbi:MAG: hypothetical protein DYH02_17425, partial [Candidatus Omnitrophica bacterium COP1]|nr:hypothetical protein [Candidatus Omnitrophica bacterium COP1]
MVIDTNVPVVANGKASQAGDGCIVACIEALELAIKNQRVLLDSLGLILEEYRKHLSPSGQPGPGDAFFKWIWDNQANPDSCKKIHITLIGADDSAVAEFPEDPELASFDPDDRKFVATALVSSENPPILNASDTDWWNHRKVL